MKLISAKSGSQVVINNLFCNKDELLSLKGMGIEIGRFFKVEKNSNGVIVSEYGRLIAIGKGLAEKIEVDYADSYNR